MQHTQYRMIEFRFCTELLRCWLVSDKPVSPSLFPACLRGAAAGAVMGGIGAEKACAETRSRVGWPVVREISSAGFWWSRFGAA